MILTPVAAADQPHQPLLVMAHSLCSQDACGEGNDAETQEHHHRNPQSHQLHLGHLVVVTNSGHDHYRPVDATRHDLQLIVKPVPLHHKDAVDEHHLQQEEKQDCRSMNQYGENEI